MKYLSGFYWERGRSKANQDSIVLQQVVTDYGRILLAAVSDGIGGLSEGENASGYIGEKMVENFYSQLIPITGKR